MRSLRVILIALAVIGAFQLIEQQLESYLMAVVVTGLFAVTLLSFGRRRRS